MGKALEKLLSSQKQRQEEASALMEKIKESTSDEKVALESIELHDDDVLRFVVRKENLKQKVKRKLTGKTEGKDQQKFRASQKLLEKGVWAEIDTEKNHVWAFIKMTSEETMMVKMSAEQSLDDDVILGVSERPTVETTFSIFVPSMMLNFQLQHDKKHYVIEAKCSSRVLTQKAEGLVGLAQQNQGDVFLIFDNTGYEAASEDGGHEVVDCRTKGVVQPPYDFYRYGEEPFVCFDIEKMGYTYAK